MRSEGCCDSLPNGDLDETIHMEIPPGFINASNSGKVCLLQKALYGLMQAPQQWCAKINSFLVHELNFTSCSYDLCLYIRHCKEITTLIVLYVDDLLIAGSRRSAVDEVKSELTRQEFLGIQILPYRGNNLIHITQSAYIEKILHRFAMTDAKDRNTPMETNPSAQTESHTSLATTFLYREAIGSLKYLLMN